MHQRWRPTQSSIQDQVWFIRTNGHVLWSLQLPGPVFLFRPLIKVNPEVRASMLIRVPLIKSILGLNIRYSYVSHSLYSSPEPDFAPSLTDSSLCSAASSSIMRTSRLNWRRCGHLIGRGTLPPNRRCSDLGRNLGTQRGRLTVSGGSSSSDDMHSSSIHFTISQCHADAELTKRP